MSNRPAAPRWLGVRERPYELRAQPMISLAAAAAIGILADRAASLTMASGLIAATLLAVVCWISFQNRRGWVWVMLAVGLAMAIRNHTDQQAYDQASIVAMIADDEQPILLRATVRSDIQRRPSLKPVHDRKGRQQPPQPQWQTRFIADVSAVRVGSDWQASSGGVFVTVDDDFSDVGPGDDVELGGNIAAFSGPTNPGESDFRTVARNRRMHARLSVDSISQTTIIQSGGPSLRRFADALARRGEQTLQQSLSDDVGPLACALVVGRRAALDADSKDRLLETGTIHLLSVSGLHLGIVAMAMMTISVLLGLGRRQQVFLVGSVCLLFAAMTGGNPPVLRAAILVATVLISLLANRRQWPLNTLAFAAILLMVYNPTNLTQVGVQLSFIAVATLVCAARSLNVIGEDLAADGFDARRQIEDLIDKTRSPWSLWMRRKFRLVRDLTWLSLCVTLSTTPLTWSNFNLISPIAVIANLLLSLPAMIALLTGLAAVVGGWIWQPLAIVPAFGCNQTLHFMRYIIETASSLPMGHFWLPAPPDWWIAIYYVVLLASFAIKRRFNRQRAFIIGSLAWCAVAWLLAVAPAWPSRPALTATFIDVGHGTSVLLEIPGPKTYLYDCGRLGNYEFTSRGIEDVLWSRGLTKLDAVILSHADSDHYNALPGLLERFRITEIIIPPGLFADPDLAKIHQLVVAEHIPIREVSIEDQWLDAESQIEVLHPLKVRLPGSDNANSVVLRIDFAGHSLVLPGDLEPPGTEAVINLPRPIAGGVLMAPHHGSLTANAQSILNWSRPSEVIVSGGVRAKRPEVLSTLQTIGSNVGVTANLGAVRVTIDESGIAVVGFRDP